MPVTGTPSDDCRLPIPRAAHAARRVAAALGTQQAARRLNDMSAPAPSSGSGARTPRITILDVLRLLTELAAFAILLIWGFVAWPFAWNILFGLLAPALAILAWALFVSPKAVFAVHPFVRVLVELLVFVSATMALWDLGYGWVGLGFGIVAVAVGLLHGRRSLE